MCTAVTLNSKDFYFGRTLDYEFSYREEVTVMPRHFPLAFRNGLTLEAHYAMIGMAFVQDNYPLYYDAVNEKGLGIAGLNFVGNAVYEKPGEGRINVAQYELIPWLLSQCASVQEAKEMLARIRITDEAFRADLPVAKLHWIIADKNEAITLECTASGMHVYDNPVGILANNPAFPEQLLRLSDFMQLSAGEPENRFAPGLTLPMYSRGMGAMGLPGDLSSRSRFVRASFVKINSVSGDSEEESVSQFFHVISSVEQQRGCCRLGSGEYEITIYTSCCNAGKGIYYYTTYGNRRITGVDMHREDLNRSTLARYPLIQGESILMQN